MMKKLLLITMICTLGFAVPAYKGEIDFKQKDGSTFKGELKGDEYFSWVEDKQGNIIKYNTKTKNYEYAKLKETNSSVDLISTGVKVDMLSGKLPSFGSAEDLKIDKEILHNLLKQKREERPYHH